MKRKMSLSVAAAVVSACFLILLVFSCSKTKDSKMAAPAKAEILSAAEVKTFYSHIKSDISEKMAALGYRYIAPDYNNNRLVETAGGGQIIYTPLFFNKETGKYIHLLVMKAGGRISGGTILLEPDKQWYGTGGRMLSAYPSMNGRISFFSSSYNSSGVLLQTIRVKNGLVSSGIEMPVGSRNTDQALPGIQRVFSNDRAASGNVQTLSASGDDACAPCHSDGGDPIYKELPPVVIISRPGAPPFIFPPVPDPTMTTPSPWTGNMPYPGGGTNPPNPNDSDNSQCCQMGASPILIESIIENISDERGPAIIDFAGNTITERKMEWYFNKNSWLFWTWKYKSYETAWLKKENGQWKFTSLIHNAIAPVGALHPCSEYDFELLQAIPSLEYSNTMARMKLHYTASYRFACPAPSEKVFKEDEVSHFWLSE